MKRAFNYLACAVVLCTIASLSAARAENVGTAGTAISAAGSRAQETSAGNLLADALRAATGADAAVVPADALTDASISPGTVTRDALKGLLNDPDDEVAVITLTGAQLRVALERSVSVHPKPFDGFLQVSGMTVEFDSGRAPGPRLMKVTVAGATLDRARTYRVATLNMLAGGGFGYYKIWSEKDVSGTGRPVLDALASYVKDQKTVSPRVEGRLVAK